MVVDEGIPRTTASSSTTESPCSCSGSIPDVRENTQPPTGGASEDGAAEESDALLDEGNGVTCTLSSDAIDNIKKVERDSKNHTRFSSLDHGAHLMVGDSRESETTKKGEDYDDSPGLPTPSRSIGPTETETLQNDLIMSANDDIMPLPSMARNTTRRASATPGAYPEGNGRHTNSYAEESASTANLYVTGPGLRSAQDLDATAEGASTANLSYAGLAVANLVSNDTLRLQELPQAEEFESAAAAQRRRAKDTKRLKMKILLAVMLFIAVLIIVVSLLATNLSNDNAASPPTMAPSSYPTQAPTLEEDYILSLLSDETAQVVLEDGNALETPQGKAFEWLLEEKDYFPFLADYRIQQRYALATLYFSTNGTEWKNNTSWLHHSIHECLWFSSLDEWYYWNGYPELYPLEHVNPCELPQEPATFMSDGVIKHLWLTSNGLTGKWAAPELYLLTQLKSLAFFWGYELQASSIPSSIASFQNLELLAMYAAGITGQIPVELGNMTNLRILEIGINALTGSIPSSIFSMTQLESFATVGSLLTGVFPSELGLLTNAKRMGVAHSQISGTIPSELGNLKAVEMMLLRTMPLVTGQIPSQIARLDNMWLFEVEASSLTGTIPAWFGNCKSLRWLTLNKNSFTGTIPTELGLLTNNFGMPGVFTLDDNKLTGTLPSELGNLDHITHFTLYGNSLVSTIPSELGKLTAVSELMLHNNNFSGVIPSELGGLSNAVKLQLNGNNLTGSVPADLEGLAWNGSIQVLNVEDNHLSGTIPDALCTIDQVSFDCSNSLCGCAGCTCSLDNGDVDWETQTSSNRTSTHWTFF